MKLGSLLVLGLILVGTATGASRRANGDLLLLRGQHVFVVTPAGNDVRELTPAGFDVEGAAWSRDGKRVAIAGNRHIWVLNADGSGLRQVTSGALSEGSPSWSPDGRRIAFSSARTGYEQVWVVSANGGAIRRVSHRAAPCTDPAWSPDGRWIAYTCAIGFPRLVVTRVGASTDRVVTPSGTATISETSPAWTPDSHTLLFTRSRGFLPPREIYSVAIGGVGLRRVVTDGSEPTVSPDGRSIAFIRATHLWVAGRGGAGAHAVTGGAVAEAGPDWGTGR